MHSSITVKSKIKSTPVPSSKINIPVKNQDFDKMHQNEKHLTYSSQYDLISLDLDIHVSRIVKSLQDKDKLLRVLRNGLGKNNLINMLQYNSSNFSPFIEKDFMTALNPYRIDALDNTKIIAVDGGLGIKRFLGLQLMLIKSAVVSYELKGKLKPIIESYPPGPNAHNYNFYSDYAPSTEFHGSLLASYRRTLSENVMLLRYIQTTAKAPEIAILDGSILPPYLPIGNKDEEITSKYYDLCKKSYFDLYDICKDKGIILIGSVKDTHSTYLRDLLIKCLPFYLAKNSCLEPLQEIPYRQILKSFTDSELIYNLLPKNYRTIIYKLDISPLIEIPIGSNLSPNVSPQGILSAPSITKEEKEKPDAFAMYLQISPLDVPLRIEFIPPKNKPNNADIIFCANKLANIISPLSSITPQCTLPIMQIEAHKQAHLPENEINLICAQVYQQFTSQQFSLLCQEKGNLQNQIDTNLNNIDTNNSFLDNYNLQDPIKAYYSTFLEKRHDRFPL